MSGLPIYYDAYDQGWYFADGGRSYGPYESEDEAEDAFAEYEAYQESMMDERRLEDHYEYDTPHEDIPDDDWLD